MEPPFQQMQEGELAWWRGFLSQRGSIPRLFAIYGYRYLPFFFDEFSHLGRVIDFGSGPVSAAFIAESAPAIVFCVDPLFQDYRKADLLYGEAMIEVSGTLTAFFDTALVLNVLDHCDDPPALLKKVAARLAHGGQALVWNHVDAIPDALHRAVTTAQIQAWLLDAGLAVMRERTFHDYGPQAYMTVAVRP